MTEKKDSQTTILKKLFRYIKKYMFLIILSLLFAAVSSVLALYVPILTGRAIDGIIGKNNVDFAGIFAVIRRMILVVAITAAAQWFMNICNNRITYQIVRDLREDAFAKIEILPLKYLDAHSHGELVSRIIADADQVAEGLLMGFTQLFTGVITILGTLCFMVSIQYKIAIVVICITPASLFAAAFIAKRTFTMFKMQSETRGEQTALVEEMVANQKVVQAFGREEEVMRRFDEINSRLQMFLKGDFFFLSDQSVYPVCQQPGLYRRGDFWSFICSRRRDQRRTACQLFKLCQSIYKTF
jgi:ATP-binding cassette subfamily B protein